MSLQSWSGRDDLRPASPALRSRPSTQPAGSQAPGYHAGETEMLCRRWRDSHDISAAARLARIHRQLFVEIVASYAAGGPPSEDLIAEGQIGLMRAICRFNSDASENFLAYAARHVRAAVHDYLAHDTGQRIGR